LLGINVTFSYLEKSVLAAYTRNLVLPVLNMCSLVKAQGGGISKIRGLGRGNRCKIHLAPKYVLKDDPSSFVRGIFMDI
jgi:hypothetical protein